MEIREFAEKVQKAMMEVLGDGYEVKLQEIQKNNGVKLQGLLILAEEQNVSPTIYLKPFWEAYEGGVTLSELVRKILQIYREDTPKESVDMAFFREFDRVKDRICYRLINARQNKELLERIPHIKFLDLAICFYYAYYSKELGEGTILIYNTHMDMWETTIAGLMHHAKANTPQLFPSETNSMQIVIQEFLKVQEERTGERFLDKDEEQQFLTDVPMKILSNKQKLYGAACMLYPGVLEQIAEQERANLFILPSSVHEVILLAERQNADVWQLRSMVRDVNKTQLEPEEVLSNSLYYYDYLEKNVKLI